MTAGQDARWRAEVVRRANLKHDARVLDIGAGTGDLAVAARQMHPSSRVTAADFTLEMLKEGQRRAALDWSAADALSLPFADSTFDAVISGFLLRNVSDCAQALREQYRVLRSPDPASGRPGGRVVILDTTQALPQSALAADLGSYAHGYPRARPVAGGKPGRLYVPD